VTCKTTKCPTGTGFSGNEAACSWTRKLCVTCLTGADSKVKVRVQTNNLPNHCFNSPKDSVTAMDIDYLANWMSTPTLQSASNPTD